MKDLTAQAKILADRVGTLSAAVEHLDRRANRGEKVIIAVVIGLILEIILSAAVATALIQLRQTDITVAETVAREERTREEALCPLYSLILGSYNPTTRPEGPARDEYIKQFDIMRGAYEALDCDGDLVPPAVTVPR